MEHLVYPNESTEYGDARDELLNDEIALRAQIETAAAKRCALPPGGKVSEDYVFERIGKNATPEKVVKMSELFGSHGMRTFGTRTRARLADTQIIEGWVRL
jgi:predicted dithiol-disulfide oxidoreductase (DUF899 family)